MVPRQVTVPTCSQSSYCNTCSNFVQNPQQVNIPVLRTRGHRVISHVCNSDTPRENASALIKFTSVANSNCINCKAQSYCVRTLSVGPQRSDVEVMHMQSKCHKVFSVTNNNQRFQGYCASLMQIYNRQSAQTPDQTNKYYLKK